MEDSLQLLYLCFQGKVTHAKLTQISKMEFLRFFFCNKKHDFPTYYMYLLFYILFMPFFVIYGIIYF